MLLIANAGVLAATGHTAPRMSPRLIAYLLGAFAAPARERLPAPPSPRQTYRSLLRLAHDRTRTADRTKAPAHDADPA
jgi:hypothetical protein